MFRTASRTWNPPNRFNPVEIDWEEPPPPALQQVSVDDSQGILNRNTSPELAFNWSLNPYRGCSHACAYCYARQYHETLGLGAGSDFERKLLITPRAAALRERALRRPGWKGELIAMSGATDCYQPLERRHRLTRACLEVCARYRQPVGIITRSPLITRDLDLLGALHAHGAAQVTLSLPILDPELSQRLEPGAPPPVTRLRAVPALAAAGLPVGISLAPVIPGLTEPQVPAIL